MRGFCVVSGLEMIAKQQQQSLCLYQEFLKSAENGFTRGKS
jgi:hypothetical protein